MFEYESTNWATGPQAQGTDEFDDCFCAGRMLIVSNDGKHDDGVGRKQGKYLFVRSKIWELLCSQQKRSGMPIGSEACGQD